MPSLRRFVPVAVLVLSPALLSTPLKADEAEIQSILRPILDVKREGVGNPAAAESWRKLVDQGPDAILPILHGLNKADLTASNWLRTAFDAVVENAHRGEQTLPLDDLLRFVKASNHEPRARRLAFETLVAIKPDLRGELLAGMLDDPSVELRRDAIAEALESAKTKEDYRALFVVSRDKDQVEAIAKKLEMLDEKPNLTKHFNFITEWSVIGPFDSSDGTGFAKVYPPEEDVVLDEDYVGKGEMKLVWKPATTEDTLGELDLNEGLGKHKFACAYAFTVIESPKERPAQIRVASNNAVKIFLNGTEVFSKEEYHHGYRWDQYIAPVTLREGQNQILIKVCQNNQDQNWAQKWSFACRVCDSTGGKIPVTVVSDR